MRIGFLLNHDQIHQVAHSLPVALALARSGTGHDISIAVTTDALAAEVERLAGVELRGRGVAIHRLHLRSPWRRGVASATAALIPSTKLLIYGDNIDYFEALDVVVVTEKTSLLLRRFPSLAGLSIIHTRHGAGDRAIGFDRSSAGFDLVLVSGAKIRRRLIDEAGVSPERIQIVGYPKFDLEPMSAMPFPEEGVPVILYNPHVSPHLSSWYRMGREVLDWFAGNPRFRLIFAPHVMLFHRRAVLTIDKLRIDRPGTLGRHILEAPNIHIDLGSPASTDMTHTRRADVYLGDVSSQVYEFMRVPRPCVFLDAHRTAWRGNPNFAHWNAGPVVDTVARLGGAIDTAVGSQRGHYLAEQRLLLARTFDITAEASSVRAARAIATFAGDKIMRGGATDTSARGGRARLRDRRIAYPATS
jgi:hypothetical protein